MDQEDSCLISAGSRAQNGAVIIPSEEPETILIGRSFIVPISLA